MKRLTFLKTLLLAATASFVSLFRPKKQTVVDFLEANGVYILWNHQCLPDGQLTELEMSTTLDRSFAFGPSFKWSDLAESTRPRCDEAFARYRLLQREPNIKLARETLLTSLLGTTIEFQDRREPLFIPSDLSSSLS